jgi:N-acyl-D-amino-acid deacylase
MRFLFDDAVQMIEDARAEGLPITADVYTYPAGATGLNVTVPPWAQDGGFDASLEHMRDLELRERIIEEMNTPSDEWENMFLLADSLDNILLVCFKSESLKPLTGKTLTEVVEMRGTSTENTIMNLIIEDGSRLGTVHFMQSEVIVRKAVELPWVSFNSDEESLAPEGVFLKSNPHPRVCGSFARVLAKYVREDKVVTLQEAVRKLSGLPLKNLKLDRRGLLQEGYFADVVFDPETIQDHATFVEPHQYATGMVLVFVNGEQVLKNGEHTGATPGKVIRGPGWTNR